MASVAAFHPHPITQAKLCTTNILGIVLRKDISRNLLSCTFTLLLASAWKHSDFGAPKFIFLMGSTFSKLISRKKLSYTGSHIKYMPKSLAASACKHLIPGNPKTTASHEEYFCANFLQCLKSTAGKTARLS